MRPKKISIKTYKLASSLKTIDVLGILLMNIATYLDIAEILLFITVHNSEFDFIVYSLDNPITPNLTLSGCFSLTPSRNHFLYKFLFLYVGGTSKLEEWICYTVDSVMLAEYWLSTLKIPSSNIGLHTSILTRKMLIL